MNILTYSILLYSWKSSLKIHSLSPITLVMSWLLPPLLLLNCLYLLEFLVACQGRYIPTSSWNPILVQFICRHSGRKSEQEDILILALDFILKNSATRTGSNLIIKEYIFILLNGSHLIFSYWFVEESIFLLLVLRLVWQSLLFEYGML